jgi:hypothetical protein
MSFFDLKVLKGKLTKPKEIKFLKAYAFGIIFFEKQTKIAIHMDL